MNTEKQPWYRHFWPWFIIALLMSTIVASLATVWISLQEPDVRVNESEKTWRGVVLDEHQE